MGKYQIINCQLVYSNGGRDTVKLVSPVIVDDIETFRMGVRATHDGCIGVNITYNELP